MNPATIGQDWDEPVYSNNEGGKIKDCPFCGGRASSLKRGYYTGRRLTDYFDIQCETKSCYLHEGADWFFDTEQQAIDKWNTRKFNGE